MELMPIFLAILTLLALYYGKILVQLWKFTRKAMKLPTNRPNPIFGHAFYFMVRPNRFVEKGYQLICENKPIFTVWVGPIPRLILYRPQHIEVILGSSKYIEKSFPYYLTKPWLGTGLITANGNKWHTHRKLITPAFHFSILEKFLKVFAEKSHILCENLEKEIGSKTFDIIPYIDICTLDIILETAMGIQDSAQDHANISDYTKALSDISGELITRVTSPWLYPDFIFYLTPSGRRFNNYLKTIHNFTDKVIRERKQQYKQGGLLQTTNENDIGKKKKLSFLDLLLETSQKGKFLSDQDIRDEVETFTFAGHDTTTAGISWSLQMLASHPEFQERAYEEMKNIFQDSDRSPTMRDLNEMKYLERFIKETLRLYPSVPTIARILQEDVEIDGYTIPAGMEIAFLIMMTQYCEDSFPDPGTFNPDNFLPERVVARHPYAYIPFSAGPRNCIGQKFAMLEMKTVLSYILRHYKLKETGKIPTSIPNIVLRPENGVNIKISPRAQ